MANQHHIKKLTKKLLRKDIKKIVALSSLEKEELKMRILFTIKQNAIIK
ncbi:MAG: hypothetical protein J6C31_06415 [Prevotella sp.]|nr:hypothetical protein [Prevotella sp.]